MEDTYICMLIDYILTYGCNEIHRLRDFMAVSAWANAKTARANVDDRQSKQNNDDAKRTTLRQIFQVEAPMNAREGTSYLSLIVVKQSVHKLVNTCVICIIIPTS